VLEDMLDSYQRAQEAASGAFQSLGVMLWGSVFTLVALLAARFLLRAFFVSWLGQKNGSFVSGLAELVLSAVILAASCINPGAVLVVLGWNAALAKQLMISLKS